MVKSHGLTPLFFVMFFYLQNWVQTCSKMIEITAGLDAFA